MSWNFSSQYIMKIISKNFSSCALFCTKIFTFAIFMAFKSLRSIIHNALLQMTWFSKLKLPRYIKDHPWKNLEAKHLFCMKIGTFARGGSYMRGQSNVWGRSYMRERLYVRGWLFHWKIIKIYDLNIPYVAWIIVQEEKYEMTEVGKSLERTLRPWHQISISCLVPFNI